MEQEKPFKTIEVIDSRTNQICKVACMSCIRGHRTTSCGIPVCRSKIFWTVKRPGRPSNSCNCQYGATGGCKCVVAKSACPHKSKKGDKRSGECRCDEQGRYCCLIEPEHWDVLLALQKPAVDFYPTRGALEARFAAPTPMPMPMMPSYPGSPQQFDNLPTTPGPHRGAQMMEQASSPYAGYQSPPAVIAPRFGMMGIGAPQGRDQAVTPNVLVWDGQVPEAPREKRRSQYQSLQHEEPQSCCQDPASPPQSTTYDPYAATTQPLALPQLQLFAPFGGVMPNVSLPPDQQPPQPSFDFGKLNNDYLNYQFPSAICQTCGLNGCTCRNCPPLMQNSINGSWAQCCGRKHARTAAYALTTVEHAFQPPLQQDPQAPVQQSHAEDILPPQDTLLPSTGDLAPRDFYQQQLFAPTPPYQQQPADLQQPPYHQPPSDAIPDFTPFDPGDAFALPEADTDLDLSDFLMQDLDCETPSRGCCCSDR